MNAQELIDTASALIAGDKGLLAMDESNPTCNKRFATLGIPQTEEARRAYRELIATTPGLGECISGAILYDETIRQQKEDDTPFVKAIGVARLDVPERLPPGALADARDQKSEFSPAVNLKVHSRQTTGSDDGGEQYLERAESCAVVLATGQETRVQE
ncbi:MAG: class I fructose-bisphosphate aldolase [Pirellulaceae bacterium]